MKLDKTRAAEETGNLQAYLSREESRPHPTQIASVTRLARLILKHPFPLFQGLLAVVVSTFAALLEPRIFGYAIDDAIIPKRWDLLKILSLAYLGTVCVRGFASIRQGYLFEKLGQSVTQDLRLMLFSHLQRLPISVFDHTPGGKLLTRVTNDISALNEMFSAGFVSMIFNLLMVLGIMVWLFLLDLRLGLITVSVFPLLLVLSAYFSRRLTHSYREARSRLSVLNSFLAENFAGIRIVHLFNRHKIHLKRFERLNEGYAKAQFGSIQVFALFQPTITVLSGVSLTLIVWFGGGDAWSGELKLGVLVTFFSYALALFQPVREIADKWNTFLSGLASAERIFAILGWETEYTGQETECPAKNLREIRGHILFENVWFCYDQDNSGHHDQKRWVLKDFSLEIKPGETVGIVGHTGAGKTTLISLLLRFYEPTQGRILLDGKDLREYDKRALRASIGIVQQEVFLFSGTFEENIDFWRSTESEAVERRNRVRGAMEFIGAKISSPDQYLNERGANFSAGERQLIAFARVLLKNPGIWILDEATSNLDSETERSLQKSLKSASEGKTCILIAHRLPTVQRASRIIVMSRGVMIESGTHETLLQQNGYYAKLYRYQEASRDFRLDQSSPYSETHPQSHSETELVK